MAFEDWCEEVDRILLRRTGIHREDHPDYPYASAYEKGITPVTMAAVVFYEWFTEYEI